MIAEVDLAADDFAREPWTYPGRPVRRSGVMHSGALHPMRPMPRQRLGQARVEDGEFTHSELNEFLESARVARVERRVLVVAVGSNGSAAVMHRKFHRATVSTTVPFVTGTLGGIAVGHSAQVSVRGYLAAAPYTAPGARTKVVVALLDPEQLRRLDATEPNYDRRTLDGARFPLVLDAGERPTTYGIYVSRRGVLAGADRACVALTPQVELYGWLLSRSADLRALVRDAAPQPAMAALADSESLRSEFRETMVRDGFIRPGGLEDLGCDPHLPCRG